VIERPLDIVCIGRSSVDLYGEQVGGRLEDVQTFAKYVGGCPTNIAVGTARLGLKSGLITRVGDEQMGRFIVETLASEGVDTRGISVDPERLTALVILGIRDRETFPHIFYRPDCADMAITEEHIDPAYITSSKTVLISGTHLSQPGVEAASRRAIRIAREGGVKVAIDIDYRPVLWGLTGHSAGENRFVADAAITERLQSILPDADLIVGTEEEIHIAGGSEDTRTALEAIRTCSDGVIVLKRGALGCIVYDGAIPTDMENGISVTGKPVTVLNTLGAGDGFMSGFLRGWIAGEDFETCCRFANGAGALVVSRLGCAPAMPSWEELQAFLAGAPADGPELDHLHRATLRTRDWPKVRALAFDHRSQFEKLAERSGADADAVKRFKDLIADAFLEAAEGVDSAGVIIDSAYGERALHRLTGNAIWIARPVELPGSRPLRFESGANVGLELRHWPAEHAAKCLVSYHPDDAEVLRAEQEASLLQLYQACVATDRDLLVEVIPPEHMAQDAHTIPRSLNAIYDKGVFPDWWKLPPMRDEAAWRAAGDVIRARDPHCRGIVVLGLDAPVEDLVASFSAAKAEPLCRGFAVGRTVFWETAERWFSGTIGDQTARSEISRKYRALAEHW